MLFERGIGAMLDQQSKVSETQLQIASGKRVVTPSDDPSSMTRILDYNRKIDTLDQYLKNADRVTTRLEVEESAISSIENTLQRVRELTVQGSSDLLSQENRTAIATEIRELRDQILAQANTRDAQGEYIFAGYQTGTVPFVESVPGVVSYAGDLGNRQLQISAQRWVEDGNNGQEVFMGIQTTSGRQSIFDTLDAIATDLEADLNVNAYLDDVDYAASHMAGVRATIGARMNAVEEQVLVNEEVKTTLELHRSGEEDLDYAEAISRMDRQLVALEAAQKAYIEVSRLSLFNYL
jgi:flagellar hook-associated protein 3 FlgL